MPLDDQSELFYHVDENDHVLGPVTRAKAHSNKSIIHRAVDIIITNSQNQILLQKRSLSKDTHPGYWTISASGHVTYGQSYQEAATRELQEEIGLKLPLTYVDKFILRYDLETEYTAIFKGQTDQTPTQLDPDEVIKVAWIKLNKLKDFIDQNNFSPGPQIILKHLNLL